MGVLMSQLNVYLFSRRGQTRKTEIINKETFTVCNEALKLELDRYSLKITLRSKSTKDSEKNSSYKNRLKRPKTFSEKYVNA